MYRDDIDPLLHQMADTSRTIERTLSQAQADFWRVNPLPSRWDYLLSLGLDPRTLSSEEVQRLTAPMDLQEAQRNQTFVRETGTKDRVIFLWKTARELCEILASGELRGRICKQEARVLDGYLDTIYAHGDEILDPSWPGTPAWQWRWRYFFNGDRYAFLIEKLLRKVDLSLADLKKKLISHSDPLYLWDLSLVFSPTYAIPTTP